MSASPAVFAFDPTPWYRHRWPWLLLAGPGIVVVAAMFTLMLAMRSDDGLVAQDYYKRGLLINRELSKTERAATIGATVSLARDGAVRVSLERAAAPDTMRLLIAHPTREGLDRTARLERSADGTYGGRVGPLSPGRWLITVETDTWRLPTVEVTAPFSTVRLGTAAALQ